MSNRQRLALRIACVLALLAAATHLFGQLQGFQPSNDIERRVLDVVSNEHLVFPGGASRTILNLLDGFGLVFVTFLGTTAGIGFLVARRASSDSRLAMALTRTLAAAYVVLTVVSITKFFIIPTACLAAVTLCLLIASI